MSQVSSVVAQNDAVVAGGVRPRPRDCRPRRTARSWSAALGGAVQGVPPDGPGRCAGSGRPSPTTTVSPPGRHQTPFRARLHPAVQLAPDDAVEMEDRSAQAHGVDVAGPAAVDRGQARVVPLSMVSQRTPSKCRMVPPAPTAKMSSAAVPQMPSRFSRRLQPPDRPGRPSGSGR